MRLVVIESPFAGNDEAARERNLQYLHHAILDCLSHAEAPFASHALYPQVLDDANPAERALGIEAGLAWACRADLTAVYHDLGISEGMWQGIAAAKAACRPVEFRSLPGWARQAQQEPHGSPK